MVKHGTTVSVASYYYKCSMTKTRFVRREFVGLICDHKAREKFLIGTNFERQV
jgi:hypothetical protein